MIQTEYRPVSVAVSVGPAYIPSKNSTPLNMAYRVLVLSGPLSVIFRFGSWPQFSSNFVGYSYC